MTSAWRDASAPRTRVNGCRLVTHADVCGQEPGIRTQHQCRHSHCSTAPECARQSSQYRVRVSQRRPNRPSSVPNRSAGTPYTRRSAWQRPTTVKAAYQVQCSAAQRPRIDPGTQIRPKSKWKTFRLAVVERNLSQILGEMLPKGDEYPNAPLACA